VVVNDRVEWGLRPAYGGGGVLTTD
jgi:hypothetical protein